MTRAQTQQALRQLPVKWALALLAIIVLYAITQPVLNSRLGWNLPSLAKLMGEPEPKKPEAKKTEHKKSADDEADKETKHKSTKSKSSKQSKEETAVGLSEQADGSEESVAADSDNTTLTTTQEPASAVDQNKSSLSKTDVASPKSVAKSPADAQGKTQTASQPAAEPKTKAGGSNSTLLYGVLKETGRDRYVSVEGLQYNPGSEEGHRLKHLERHLQDMPDRPGKHGVFDGEMKDALKWIDDAYARGKRGAKGVHKSEEDGRTVYEVPFTQRIGYIGGRDGNRAGKPAAKRLRLVVDGSKFITAFPF